MTFIHDSSDEQLSLLSIFSYDCCLNRSLEKLRVKFSAFEGYDFKRSLYFHYIYECTVIRKKAREETGQQTIIEESKMHGIVCRNMHGIKFTTV